MITENKIYGYLTVLKKLRQKASDGHSLWQCRCTCGKIKKVASNNLGRTTFSCGCRRGKNSITHGHSTNGKLSTTYNSWRAMIARCTNPNNNRYLLYGARGIKVCGRWKKFSNFLIDMGERPVNKTLDRKDNDGDYTPSNCQWATSRQQMKNRRSRAQWLFG